MIGLTGDVGAGKTEVRRWLQGRGAAALDADLVVHRLLAEDSGVMAAVAARFGAEVAPGGRIDRAALAGRVFQDGGALADLETMLYPSVLATVRAWVAEVTAGVAVVEAVKLVESGLDVGLGQVWLVTCARAIRRQRLVARGWSLAEAERRMAARTALAPRLARADVVVDNGGSWDATARQLAVAWRRLVELGGA